MSSKSGQKGTVKGSKPAAPAKKEEPPASPPAQPAVVTIQPMEMYNNAYSDYLKEIMSWPSKALSFFLPAISATPLADNAL
jgi:hypothetical protein